MENEQVMERLREIMKEVQNLSDKIRGFGFSERIDIRLSENGYVNIDLHINGKDMSICRVNQASKTELIEKRVL